MTSTETVSRTKRSSPPPPADLSRPNEGQPPSKRQARESKFDPSVLPTSTSTAEILKQVEFYFSDANLPRDKFLWNLTVSDSEGWVPIATIANFKRMRRFQPLDTIVSALRTSPALLEVNDKGTHVRRKIPLVKPSEEEFTGIQERTVYVTGFGEETSTMQIDLEAFFRGFGEIDSLRLRRTGTGLFKGSVLVQFENKKVAETFLAEPREYAGNLLETKSKHAWIQDKIEEAETLGPEERKERDAKRAAESKFTKPFSAFKELEKREQWAKKRDTTTAGKRGRRGNREDVRRGRSRSPTVKDKQETGANEGVASAKRPLEDGDEQTTSKREKVENGQKGTEGNVKRSGDSLESESKKMKK